MSNLKRFTKLKEDYYIQYRVTGCYNDMNRKGDYAMGDSVDRFAELENGLENRKVIELPCKVGDVIYWSNGMLCGGIVSNINVSIYKDSISGNLYVQCGDYVEEFNLEDFNKKWFLSEEDLLKEEENENT